jgi:hypothetical protein
MSDPMVEYEKVMTEIVHINLPAPEEPKPGMSGSELFYGFVAHSNLNGVLSSTLCDVEDLLSRSDSGWR